MPLTVYNTLTRRKEPFVPLDPHHVRLYVCGPTVYDFAHIGNGRPYVIFDVLTRLLRHLYPKVTYARNITDIDDKIIAALIEKEHAYEKDGHVLFSVRSFPSYGRLSRCQHDEMIAGARVEVAPYKRDPEDFVLWKPSEKGVPGWKSPWCYGRPGWHIECSAMSSKYLGETFDIHGGGQDLIFPHHENEIAQSCSATGKEFARYWVHNGFVTVDQEKMSKSLGNFFTIKEIFEKFPAPEKVTAEVVRYFLLSTQYRSPIDFSDEALRQARAGLNNFYDLLLRLDEQASSKETAGGDVKELLSKFTAAFEQAMDDDCNTPVAIAEFQRLRGELNQRLQTGLSQGARTEAYEAFRRFGQVLGLFQVLVKEWEFKETKDVTVEFTGVEAKTQIELLIAARNEARSKKDFAKADAIRKELAAQNIILEDRPDGTTRWKR